MVVQEYTTILPLPIWKDFDLIRRSDGFRSMLIPLLRLSRTRHRLELRSMVLGSILSERLRLSEIFQERVSIISRIRM